MKIERGYTFACECLFTVRMFYNDENVLKNCFQSLICEIINKLLHSDFFYFIHSFLYYILYIMDYVLKCFFLI